MMKQWVVAMILCVSAALSVAQDQDGQERVGRKEDRRIGNPAARRRPDGEHASEGGLLHQLENSDVRSRLGLDENEAAALRERLQELKKRGDVLWEVNRTLARQQADMLRQPDISEEAIMDLVEQVGRVRTDIARLKMEELLTIRRILGPERMTRMWERRERGRRPNQNGHERPGGRGDARPREPGGEPPQD